MPKYLLTASYTAEGVRGLLKDGGTKRRAAIEAAARSVGATVEAMYFAFGDTDGFVVIDAPDAESAAALSLAVAASGAASNKTVALLTPEQVDQAVRKSVGYTPPGS